LGRDAEAVEVAAELGRDAEAVEVAAELGLDTDESGKVAALLLCGGVRFVEDVRDTGTPVG